MPAWACTVASHDRAFLDRAVTKIIELDGINERPQWYEGGYTAYRAEKLAILVNCGARILMLDEPTISTSTRWTSWRRRCGTAGARW
jgi:ATPase subunit of ABC transporter with duplicated ATPase domains